MNVIKRNFPLLHNFPFSASDTTIVHTEEENIIYHWHECLEISFVRSGKGVYYVNGNVCSMEPGDIILFNTMEIHAWNATSDEPMIQPVIIFDPALIWAGQENLFDYEYLKAFNGYCTNFNNKLPSHNYVTQKIYGILEDILYEYIEKPPAYHLMIKTKLLEVMTYLIRHFHDNEKSLETITHKKQKLQRLQKVIEYMNVKYSEVIMIDEAAQIANMNVSYFSTFFKKVIGVTFIDYLTKLRITKAVHLIENTNETLTSIAFACGFNSMSNFYRAYKKFKGGTPSAIR